MQVKFYKFIHICSATNIKSNNDHIAKGIGPNHIMNMFFAFMSMILKKHMFKIDFSKNASF